MQILASRNNKPTSVTPAMPVVIMEPFTKPPTLNEQDKEDMLSMLNYFGLDADTSRPDTACCSAAASEQTSSTKRLRVSISDEDE